jgi:two-component sensor histidine kinase
MRKPTIRVLYIDDDLPLVRLVQKVLGRKGFSVEHALGLDDAMTRIAGGHVDVVALDHYLESGTGLDILARLTALEKAPPVVYVTGTSEMNVAVAALRTGAADFFPKTVGDDFLVLLGSALEKAVEKARLKAEKDAANEEVRVARDRAELLLAEVNHRVANSLQLVVSLVGLQANAITDQVAKDALAETQARIHAIASVHKRLYSSVDVRAVILSDYLGSLLGQLEASMHSEGHGASLTHDIEPLVLGPDASIGLGIVLTEWVTNAFKYAYPGRSGAVRVRLRRLDERHGELRVEDDGVGRGDAASARGTGLGSRIVRAMASTIGAEIGYADRLPGTTARLIFPLAAH